MKKIFVTALSGTLILTGLSSCHSNASGGDGNQDTAIRTSSDTTVISGTPGPSGSQPGPGDTTKAHRDSLKHVVHTPDSVEQTKR